VEVPAFAHALVEVVRGARPPVVIEMLAIGTHVGELDHLHAKALGDPLREVGTGIHDDVHVPTFVIGLAQARQLLRRLGIGGSFDLSRLNGFRAVLTAHSLPQSWA